MSSAQKQYTNEMYRKFGYYATWNPGSPLQLGDVGYFKKNVFNRISGLDDFNIEFDIRHDPTKTPLEHSSQGSVKVTTKLSGAISPQASVLSDVDAGIIVEFSKENATLFKALNTTTNSIRNTISLGERILKLYEEKKWDKDWMIITELIEAESATIIISNQSDGKIELKANANVGAANFDIADGRFEFSPQFSRGLETKIISSEGLTPLFKVMGVRGRLLGSPIFKSNVPEGLENNEPVFEEINDLYEEGEFAEDNQ